MESLGRWASGKRQAFLIIISSFILILLSLYGASKLEFEYNMLELEPEDLQSVLAQKKIIDKFELSPDFAMYISDSEDECRKEVKSLKKMADKTGILGRIDAVTEYFTTEAEQLKNSVIIEQFRDSLSVQGTNEEVTDSEKEMIITELERLHANIVEIGELSVLSKGENNKVIRKCDEITGKKDSDSQVLKLAELLRKDNLIANNLSGFQKAYAPVLKNMLMDMSNPEVIGFNDLPEKIKERYTNKNNDKLLVSVFPKNNIWEEKNLRKFQRETQKVNPEVTGTPVISLLFIDLITEKGKVAIIAGAVVIILLLLMDFRSVKYTILALIPVTIGSVFLLGLIYFFGMKLNYVNFMALPIILGIGIDDGVHILHRYIIEGKNSIPVVIRYTGKAILLTSLTTMIGFGSMGFITHRGIASMGIVLFIGVGACFITSSVLLPAIITFVEKNGKK